jgi:serine/threonine protein kinase/tetratricopeptide (TPR) repeat protein
MSTSDHQRLEEIFTAALACAEPAERRGFLAQACGDDMQMRTQVEKLLEAHTKTDGFLESPLVDPDATLGAEHPEGAIQGHIGLYRIHQVLGEGGFGVVYLAEQEQPVRRFVALKIIKLGMDTRQVIARFEAERHALALMDHPNIARVLDAGATPAGRPYFVMELVRGIPITEHCRRERLGIRQRLELFLHVCQAVQHAHQKGIVHRDIKPRNILITRVDSVAVPKVIDFGIAKATSQPLGERPAFTEFRQFLGTPEYMSPEQGDDGMDVDTRTDIYSLGVVLYELLTGVTPLDAAALRRIGMEELRRQLREIESSWPSVRLRQQLGADEGLAATFGAAGALPRMLRGDLDWIVMKALEKDRARRYQTVNEFARDIQRHMQNEPVTAGPPGLAYRASKFFRRNRGLVSAGLVVGLALVTGLLLATTGWMQAMRSQSALREERDTAERARGDAELARSEERAQRQLAERNAQNALAANQFLREMIASVNPNYTRGRDVSMRYVLDEAARRIAGGALVEQPEVEAGLRVTLGETYEALGLYALAETQLRTAGQLLQETLGEQHPDCLRCRSALIGVLNGQLRHEEAEELATALLALQVRLLGEEHADTLATRSRLGIALAGRSKVVEAERVHRQTVGIQRRLLGEEHPETLRSQTNLALVQQAQGRHDEAELLLRHVLDRQRRVLGPQHSEVTRTLNALALVLESRGKFAAAETLYRESWETDQRILGADHPHTQLAMNNLLRVLQTQGKSEAMRPLVELRLARLRAEGAAPDAGVMALNTYAWELLTCQPPDLRDPEQALQVARRAAVLDGERDAGVLETLALAQRQANDLAGAIDTQRRAIEVARAGGPYDRREMEERLIEMLLADGRVLEAASLQLVDLAAGLGKSVAEDYYSTGGTLLTQARDLMRRGNWTAAEAPLRACLVLRQRSLPAEHWAVAEVNGLLGEVWVQLGRTEEARQTLTEALRVLSDNPQAPRRLVDRARAQLEAIPPADTSRTSPGSGDPD